MRIAVPHALQSMTSSSSQTKWKFVRNATMKQQSINKQNGQKKYIIIYLINPFIWCKSGLWRLLVQATGPGCQLHLIFSRPKISVSSPILGLTHSYQNLSWIFRAANCRTFPSTWQHDREHTEPFITLWRHCCVPFYICPKRLNS